MRSGSFLTHVWLFHRNSFEGDLMNRPQSKANAKKSPVKRKKNLLAEEIHERIDRTHVPEDWYKNFYHLDKYQVCKICGLRNPKTLSNWVMQGKLPKPVIAVGKRRWQSLSLFEALQSTEGSSI